MTQSPEEAHLQHDKRPLPRLLGRLLTAIVLLLAFTAADPFGGAAGEDASAVLAIALALLAGLLLAEQPAYFPIALAAAQSVAFHGSLTAAAICTVVGTAIFLALLGLYRLRGGRPKLSAFFDRLRPLKYVLVVCLGAAAVAMTLYQGMAYFEVGVKGAGIAALLRNCRTLGFHPNWRAVLYSTIMMVVLITWPRKFRRLSRVLPGGFVGICMVTALNLLLNPDSARTTVLELGRAGGFLFARLPISALAMVLIFVSWEAFAEAVRRGKKPRADSRGRKTITVEVWFHDGVHRNSGASADLAYRPHFVVKGAEEYLGVQFQSFEDPLPGEHILCNADLLYDGVDYTGLVPGASFFIKEGARMVGEGIIVKRE